MKKLTILMLLVLVNVMGFAQQNTQTFTYQGFVFQNYTIPTSGYYLINAKGGEGGSCNGYAGGKGASMSSYTYFTAGTQLRITVAGAGGSVMGYENGAGGGGSSSVVIANGGNSFTPVIIAGGGGGAGNSNDGVDGQITEYATDGTLPLYSSGIGLAKNPPIAPGTGGSSGNGGGSHYYWYQVSGKGQVNREIFANGGGGAGYFTDGISSRDEQGVVYAWAGQAYLSGNYGGGGHPGGDGGWGGGGEGGQGQEVTDCCSTTSYWGGSGGGGGGYSGGGAGCPTDGCYCSQPDPLIGKTGGGGGGGSYIAPNSNTVGLTQIAGDNTGNGLVTITGPNTSTYNVIASPNNPYIWSVNGQSYTAAGTYYYLDSANAVMRVLNLLFGLQFCPSTTRVDTTVVSCGGYTSALNGRTYTQNTTDSIRIGCTKYVAQIIVEPPSTALAIPGNLGGIFCFGPTLFWSSSSHDHATRDFVACRNTVDTFTVAEVPYATSYQWSLPSGASGSSTTNRIVVSFSNQFSGGPISVTPVNACGNGDTLMMNIAHASHPPAGQINISDPTLRVSGMYSVTPIPGATTYTWSVSNNQAVIVSGQGTPTIHLEALPGFTRANLSVVASNCKGNGARGNIPLNNNGGNLGVAWNYPRIASTQPADISVFPNPSNGQFTISTPSLQTDATLEVYSTDGRLVYQQTIPSTTTETSIDLQHPAAGLYQVRIIAGGEVRMTKVVVN